MSIIRPLFCGKLHVFTMGIMIGLRYTNWLILIGLAVASGCSSPKWSLDNAAPGPTATGPMSMEPVQALPTQPAPTQPTPPPPVPAAAGGPATPGPQTLQQVMAEVQEVGAGDPALQAKLLSELQAAEPSLWPLVVRNFRARVAFSEQLRQQEAASRGEDTELASRRLPTVEEPTLPPPTPAEKTPVPRTMQSAGAETRIARLPVSTDAAQPPMDPPGADYPRTENPEPPAVLIERPPSDRQSAAEPSAAESSEEVVRASYAKEAATDWRAPLSEAIALLQSEAPGEPSSDAEIARHARLRILQLAAGARDEALTPIPSATPSVADFWSKELFGLAVLLNAEQIPQSPRRAAEAKRHLAEAINALGESASLEVRNLAFCREVQSYGSVKRFDKYEFSPDQRLLLYAEVENFKSEDTARGYHTSLRSRYQIFDAGGRPVDQQESTSTEEHCTNPRRDYFIGCDFRLPKRIYPGRHTLKLTVEDLKSQKIGESSIEFTIK